MILARLKIQVGVSTHSIRYRILKADMEALDTEFEKSFNPFDPIQDTESSPGDQPVVGLLIVSTHSIRYRILKAG